MALEITINDATYGVGVDNRTGQKVLAFKDKLSGIEVVIPLAEHAREDILQMLATGADVPTLAEMNEMVKNVRIKAPTATAGAGGGRIG